jgi:hypothetical protein
MRTLTSLLERGGDTTDIYACRLKTRKRFLMGSAEDLGGTGIAVGMVRIAGRRGVAAASAHRLLRVDRVWRSCGH